MNTWIRWVAAGGALLAGGAQVPFSEKYITAIKLGTDPQSPGYWGETGPYDQRLVEMAAYGLGLALRHASPATRTVVEDLSNGVTLIVRVVIRFAPFGIFGLVGATLTESGLGALLETSALAFNVVKFCGAAYLIWLGIQKWRSLPQAIDAPAQLLSARGLFLEGLLVNLTNPKAILFFAHRRYTIRTQGLMVEGTGGEYRLSMANTAISGTQITVELDDDSDLFDEWRERIEHYAAHCYMEYATGRPVAIRLDGDELPQNNDSAYDFYVQTPVGMVWYN